MYHIYVQTDLRGMANGPRESNSNLLIKSQVILFSTHHEALNDYKYAGYPMLIKTIQMETALPDLFSKETDLLGPCCELVYYTLRASALNSEELCETGGIETLQGSFSRCVDVIGLRGEDTPPFLSKKRFRPVFKGKNIFFIFFPYQNWAKL